MSDPDFGPAVRAIRRSRGLSQRELAAAAGITRTQLLRIELGHEPAGRRTYLALVHALGFTYGRDLMDAARELQR